MSGIPREQRDPLRRFHARHTTGGDGGCWTWTGSVSSGGYGNFSLNGRTTTAHRAAWTLLRGPIPSGTTLDHLCRERLCVNPDHLELVTQRENNLRAPNTATARNVAKLECPRGHAYTPDNTYTSSGRRQCVTCTKQRDSRRQRVRVSP